LSVSVDRAQIPHVAYADAVLGELERRAPELAGRPIASVFFGGGTPSLWEPRELGRVLAAIRRAFRDDASREASGEVEVTVECNPTSFDRERAQALLDAGVNRVSIGVQSLDERRLAFLGRLHDVDGGLRALENALAAGVPRVSADLMFGVAGQSSEDAVREVTRVASLGPTHVSAYALTIEPGTEFGALARKGKLPLAGDDSVADSLLAIGEALALLGFEHYEISNYAKAGQYSVHNLGYWTGRDYLGLGCGAWGTLTLDGRRDRYRNTPSPERYLSQGAVESVRERIDAEMALRERLMLGLRLRDGLDLDGAARELGLEAWTPERRRAAERLERTGRLNKIGGRIWIPEASWRVADGIIAALI
jgi:oxygen-independent coproporphyrinogen-3 oxidase